MKTTDETYVPVWRREGGAFLGLARVRSICENPRRTFCVSFLNSPTENLRPPGEGLKSDPFSVAGGSSFERSSAKIGTIQRRLAYGPCSKDDTHKSRMYHFFRFGSKSWGFSPSHFDCVS